MKHKAFLLTAVAAFLFISGNTVAAREWNYQRVVTSWGESLGSGNTAIGMRSGHTWPVVMTNQNAAAMIPGGWVASSEGFFGGRIDAATSHDGQRMIFANDIGQIKMFGPSGWSNSLVPAQTFRPDGRNSVAYTQQDNAAVLYSSPLTGDLMLSVQQGGQWNTSSLGQYAEGYALAYDSYDQANVALNQYGMLSYGTKGVLTNHQWHFSEPIPQLFPAGDVLDLELTSNDIPFIAYGDGSMLNYATYDRIHGQWQTGLIDFMMDNNFCMASDQQGGIGIAYITETPVASRLGFAYTDGSGLWETELLPMDIFDEFGSPIDFLNISSWDGIGLAFDNDNNPVISFSNNGETWIAYDPMVVPEPATCFLLLLGGMTIRKSRKNA